MQAEARLWMGVFDEWGQLIVLANRAPYRYDRGPNGRVSLTRTASGLVTALEPLVDARSRVWGAQGAGTAGTLPPHTRDLPPRVPPANPSYRVRYVPIDADQYRGFYDGFANEALWPLCHS